MAYLILAVVAVLMLSSQSCDTLKQRNKELDKLSGIRVAQAAEERLSLSQVQSQIRFAQDTHQMWLNFLENNPQWLKDHKAEVDAVPTLYDPGWHRYWIKVYGATLDYLKQVPDK